MSTGLTGIIPFTYTGGNRKAVGSTYLRVDCLTECVEGFEKFVHGKKYDNLIFQKVYWKEMLELFTGPKILDLCDPDWLVDDIDIVEIGNLADAITCSSEALTQLVKRYFPSDKIVHCIPDRLNFNKFPSPRKPHEQKASEVVWFGFIHNAHETLEEVLPAIKKHRLKLRIISDKPYSKEDDVLNYKPSFTRYDQDTAYTLLQKSDIVLNPRSTKGFYKYKSDNKTIIGWKLGLPVAITNDDIERFIDPEQRNKEVAERKTLVEREFNIIKSAEEYEEIIRIIRDSIRH